MNVYSLKRLFICYGMKIQTCVWVMSTFTFNLTSPDLASNINIIGKPNNN